MSSGDSCNTDRHPSLPTFISMNSDPEHRKVSTVAYSFNPEDPNATQKADAVNCVPKSDCIVDSVSVVTLVIGPDGKESAVVLCQPRPNVNEMVYGFVTGGLDPKDCGAEPEDYRTASRNASRRELFEESGLEEGKDGVLSITFPLGGVMSVKCPSLSGARGSLEYATVWSTQHMTNLPPPHLDPGEVIDRRELVPVFDVPKFIQDRCSRSTNHSATHPGVDTQLSDFAAWISVIDQLGKGNDARRSSSGISADYGDPRSDGKHSLLEDEDVAATFKGQLFTIYPRSFREKEGISKKKTVDQVNVKAQDKMIVVPLIRDPSGQYFTIAQTSFSATANDKSKLNSWRSRASRSKSGSETPMPGVGDWVLEFGHHHVNPNVVYDQMQDSTLVRDMLGLDSARYRDVKWIVSNQDSFPDSGLHDQRTTLSIVHLDACDGITNADLNSPQNVLTSSVDSACPDSRINGRFFVPIKDMTSVMDSHIEEGYAVDQRYANACMTLGIGTHRGWDGLSSLLK